MQPNPWGLWKRQDHQEQQLVPFRELAFWKILLFHKFQTDRSRFFYISFLPHYMFHLELFNRESSSVATSTPKENLLVQISRHVSSNVNPCQLIGFCSLQYLTATKSSTRATCIACQFPEAKHLSSNWFNSIPHIYYSNSWLCHLFCFLLDLLEKSRVIDQGSDERSYHIFYQILKAADDDLHSKLQ